MNYNRRMNKNNKEPNNGRQSPAKLTFLFVLLPVLVIALMIVFWVIFKETRKQVELTEQPAVSVINPVDRCEIKRNS